jgi:hypothetical protein
LNTTQGTVAFVDMSNVLSEAKKQQVIALGRLGWPLRRIEQETGVRRETAGVYLKAAGIGVRPPGAWGRRAPGNNASLSLFRHRVLVCWWHTIRRRSQKHRINWTRMLDLAQRWLPPPPVLHPFPDARFAATHPR